jgi:hypothetical protein
MNKICFTPLGFKISYKPFFWILAASGPKPTFLILDTHNLKSFKKWPFYYQLLSSV